MELVTYPSPTVSGRTGLRTQASRKAHPGLLFCTQYHHGPIYCTTGAPKTAEMLTLLFSRCTRQKNWKKTTSFHLLFTLSED